MAMFRCGGGGKIFKVKKWIDRKGSFKFTKALDVNITNNYGKDVYYAVQVSFPSIGSGTFLTTLKIGNETFEETGNNQKTDTGFLVKLKNGETFNLKATSSTGSYTNASYFYLVYEEWMQCYEYNSTTKKTMQTDDFAIVVQLNGITVERKWKKQKQYLSQL